MNKDRNIVAVIDIGSTAIRMVVAEIDSDGSWKRLDRAGKPVSLGRDVFMSGYLSRESIRRTIQILIGFRELLDGWNVRSEEVRAIATSAIREARNRDAFLDRVLMRTGIRVQVVEGVEENHLTYLAVQHAIGSMRPQFSRSNALIMEVGGGTSEIMMLRRGRIAAAHSLRLGTVRLQQQLASTPDRDQQIEEFLRESVRTAREVFNAEMPLARIKYFVAVGGDARLAASAAGKPVGDQFSLLEREDFEAFVAGLQGSGVDDLVRELNVTYNEAEGLVPALLVYKSFLETTGATQVIVPDVSIREGVLMSLALGHDKSVDKDVYRQVVASAVSLGRKFHFDEAHAKHVATLALRLFDELQRDHGLDQHARLLLEVACLLHDIGNFIRVSGHHKHSQYIVANSEIFGFSRDDIRIVSNVVRYHRKNVPSMAHPAYASLHRDQRMAVLKMSAILRVADALDRGHVQRIHDFRIEVGEDDLVLHCEYSGDVSVERYGLTAKGRLFEDVFGYRVVIT